MDKQTFCSSQTTSNTARYAAALYRQGTWVWLYRGESTRWAGPGDLTQPRSPQLYVWFWPLLNTKPCRIKAVWK